MRMENSKILREIQVNSQVHAAVDAEASRPYLTQTGQ